MSKIESSDLKKISTEISDILCSKPPISDQIEEVVEQTIPKIKPVRHVNFQTTQSSGAQLSPPPASPQVKTDASGVDLLSIAGLNIPTHTLYLVIVLIVLGIFIWN